MEEQVRIKELLSFFKALADANRLKIVGLLSQQELTVEQMAEMLELSPSTVSHHLSKLGKVGLVNARAESYYNLYRLDTDALEDMARRLLARETLPAVAADVDIDAYDRKIVNDYSSPDGRFWSLPSQQKKLLAILRYLARQFEPGVRYSEKQVNEVLKRFHEDFAGLRRDMIDFGLMEREGGGGEYWLTEK